MDFTVFPWGIVPVGSPMVGYSFQVTPTKLPTFRVQLLLPERVKATFADLTPMGEGKVVLHALDGVKVKPLIKIGSPEVLPYYWQLAKHLRVHIGAPKRSVLHHVDLPLFVAYGFYCRDHQLEPRTMLDAMSDAWLRSRRRPMALRVQVAMGRGSVAMLPDQVAKFDIIHAAARRAAHEAAIQEAEKRLTAYAYEHLKGLNAVGEAYASTHRNAKVYDALGADAAAVGRARYVGEHVAKARRTESTTWRGLLNKIAFGL